ncbi:MAG: TrkH family potassium uptake protein [Spirochaetales bacterium]|nr:TrkH family potassium uptake protein [Spirochaetales bacterium]
MKKTLSFRFSFLAFTSLLSIISIFLEHIDNPGTGLFILVQAVDVLLVALICAELLVAYRNTTIKKAFIRVNLGKVLVTLAYILLLATSKVLVFSGSSATRFIPSSLVIILRNSFLFTKLLTRLKRFTTLLKRAAAHPSQYIVYSFVIVILVGTAAFMVPFTRAGGKGFGFVDSLFTSTSAVCVTGLSVIDVSAVMTRFGQIILLVLIQIGGLGIMILSYFAMFSIRRSLSIEDKYMLSYLLSEGDMARLGKSVGRIIAITFSAELIGAVLLFFAFDGIYQHPGERVFSAVFHSVSAFCNAGFSLFPTSLEGFSGNIAANLTVCGLIICGAVGFSAMSDLLGFGAGLFSRRRRRVLAGRVTRAAVRFSETTKVVLRWTLFLIISGMFMVFAFEFAGSFRGMSTGQKIMAAFFQSVTLRTAGFNTVPIPAVGLPVLMVMIIFMFIGGASGGTAGGVKINTVAVIRNYIASKIRGNRDTLVAQKYTLYEETVRKAFLLFFFGICAILVGTTLLSVWEKFPLEDILFEVVSAFGTVGLSRGITADIHTASRFVLIVLMFMGRVGMLTVFTALSRRRYADSMKRPAIDIMIG